MVHTVGSLRISVCASENERLRGDHSVHEHCDHEQRSHDAPAESPVEVGLHPQHEFDVQAQVFQAWNFEKKSSVLFSLAS